MKKLVISLVLATTVLFCQFFTVTAANYVQKDIHISSQLCNETAPHSGNSSDYDIPSYLVNDGEAIMNHQFTWYSHNSTGHNQTSVAGNLTIWTDLDTGTWINLSNGTTYHNDRAIVLVSDKSLSKIRIEMCRNFKNATGDTAWANMTVKYRGWSY